MSGAFPIARSLKLATFFFTMHTQQNCLPCQCDKCEVSPAEVPGVCALLLVKCLLPCTVLLSARPSPHKHSNLSCNSMGDVFLHRLVGWRKEVTQKTGGSLSTDPLYYSS